ncbi:MAG: hypothetical protein NC419_02750 [Muribaculaceae bacterium]|nr:hypothetical protein [Muribaculaceae bacterium]
MKKVVKTLKQSLSILLAVAMVITCVPQTTTSVLAAPDEDVTAETGIDTDAQEIETPVSTPDTNLTSDDASGDDTEESTEGGETTDPEEGGETIDPGEGGETTEPGEGGETNDPAEGGETTDPGEGDETTDPAEGDNTVYTVTFPTPEEDHATVTIKGGAEKNEETGAWTVISDTDITFTVTPVTEYAVDAVSYTVGGEKEVTLTAAEGEADAEAVYTIPKDAITGNIVIKVTTKAVEAKNITLTLKDYTDKETNKFEVFPLTKVEGDGYNSTYKKADTAVTADGWTVEKGQDVFFIVEADERYNVTVESANGSIPQQCVRLSEAKEYAWAYYVGDVSADTQITVTLEVKQNKNSGAYWASFTSAVDATYDISTNGNKTPNLTDTSVEKKRVITTLEDITYTITPRANYRVEKVEKIIDEETEPEPLEDIDSDDTTFTFAGKFSQDEKSVTYRVTVTAIPLTEDGGTITFKQDDVATGLTLDVTPAGVEATSTENQYQVKSGAQYVEFALTAANTSIAPVVIVGGDEEEWPAENAEEREDTDPYLYKVRASRFTAGTNTDISISQKAAPKTLTIVSNEEYFERLAVAVTGKEDTWNFGDGDGYYLYDDDDEIIGYYWNCTIPAGSEVTIDAEADSRHKIASYQIGSGAVQTVDDKNAAITWTLTDHTTVDITQADAPYVAELRLGDGYDGTLVEAVEDGVYSVNNGQTYTILMNRGGEQEYLEKATITLADGTVCASTVTTNSTTKAAVTVSAEDAGKELLVSVWSDNDAWEDDHAPSVTLRLKVKNAIGTAATQATVTGVKNGELTQTVDTRQTYEIKVEPAEADADNLNAVVEWPEQATNTDKETVKAVIVDGKLVITTAPVQNQAAIDALNELAPKISLKGTGDALTTFTLILEAPKALTGLTPTLKLKSSNDISLTLTLGVPAKVNLPVNKGKLWYKVVVEQKGTDTVTGNDIAEGGKATYYIEKIADKATQDETIQLINREFGSGVACNFTVNATVVQTIDKTDLNKLTEAAIAGKIAFESKAKSVSAATKTPYYATKLTLKKGTTNVYTGMEGVKIATINFGKDATYTDDNTVTVEDVTTGVTTIPKEAFKVEGGDVKITLNGDTLDWDDEGFLDAAIGKHTIRVTADAPSDVTPAHADIVITLNRGIETFYLTYASDTIWKPTGKAVSLKGTPTYNWNESQYQPKTKKVKDYVLVKAAKDENGIYSPAKKSDGTDDILENIQGLFINTKNGTISVTKDYNVTGTDQDKFFVRATSADWTDKASGTSSSVPGYSQLITVTGAALELGEVVVVGWDNENGGYYIPILGGSAKNVTSEKLSDAKVAVLKPGITAKTEGVYSADNFVDSGYLSYKSNSKALTVDKDGLVKVTKANPKANIILTVSNNDGSKKSAQLKGISIGYETPDLGLRVERQNAWARTGEDENFQRIGGTDYGYKNSTISYNAASDSVLRLVVLEKEGEDENGKAFYEPIHSYANYTIAVNGAKVLSKTTDAYGQCYTTILPNKKDVTVTLTDKGNNLRKVTYTITNTGFSPATIAAKNIKTTDKLTAGVNQHQEIRYNVTNLPDSLVSVCEEEQLYVMVRTDATDRRNAKKASSYATFEQAGNVIDCIAVEPYEYQVKKGKNTVTMTGGTFVLNFNEAVPAGSYKLQLTFGTANNDSSYENENYNEIQPLTKAVAVTLKATAVKKGSYKPVTTVKMSVKDMPQVTLAGTGKNYDNECYYNLRNANLKGVSNGFTDYFEAVYEKDSDGEDTDTVVALKLKDFEAIRQLLAQEQKKEAKDITDNEVNERLDWLTGNTKNKNAKGLTSKDVRTGYISYEVYNLDGTLLKRDVTKLTVNFTSATTDLAKVKSVSAYAAAGVKIMEGTKNAELHVTAAKKPADIAYAYVATNDGGFEVAKVEGDTISLEIKGTPAVKGHKLTLYVVPANSYYVSEIRNLATAAEKTDFVDAITTKGVKLTPTVTVVRKATGKKVTVAKANLKQTFAVNNEDGLRGYDGQNANYWIDVPYTMNVGGVHIVDKIVTTVKDTNNQNSTELINCYPNYQRGVEDGGNYIGISINKADINKVKWSKNGTVQVKAELPFGMLKKEELKDNDWYDEDLTITKETLTFTLTRPKEVSHENNVKNVKENIEKIATAVEKEKKPAFWRDMHINVSNYVAQDNMYYLHEIQWEDRQEVHNDLFDSFTEAIWMVHDIITEMYVLEDSTSVEMPQFQTWRGENQYTEWLALSGEDFTLPTLTTKGKFTVQVELKDPDKPETKEIVKIPLTIDTLKEQPSDVKDALETFVEEVQSRNLYNLRSNTADYDKIARAARDYIKLSGYPTLRLDVWDPERDEKGEHKGMFYLDDFGWVSETRQEATEEEDGYIAALLHVYGSRYGGQEVFVPFTIIIPKLNPEVEDLKAKLDGIVEANLTKLEGIDGVNDVTYDRDRNKFTVTVTDDPKKVVDYCETWKKANEEAYKKELVDSLTEAFGKEWESVSGITVNAKAFATNPLTATDIEKEITVSVTKQSGETIEAFADRMQKEAEKKYEAALKRYPDAKDVVFPALHGATGNVNITVAYIDATSVSQAYLLTVK